ncbi:hypothetical protein IP87_05595 [beta proteobacterium AAP121]|nr:hypothetical protein IP80_07295 [beta proteobacterium AAP65]KPF99406.1 hypothetical protein IP87_05595 [beta proteobacterium AAP121]
MNHQNLVIGASGTVGSALVQALQARGQSVRQATSRTPTHADQVQIDVLKGQGLQAAFEGVQRAFLMAPPGYVPQDHLLLPLIAQAQAAGVQKVVLMTAMGSDAAPDTPLRKAELALEASGIAWNTVRPNWFMQNFHTFWLQGIREQGRIFLPTGTARGSFIDARDIADVVAELLLGDAHGNQAFDLTGAEALNHDEVAQVLSRETGRDIRYQDIPPEAMLQGLLGAGLPGPYAEFLVMILGFFAAGYAERQTDAVQRITGRAPRCFAAYAREFRANWIV